VHTARRAAADADVSELATAATTAISRMRHHVRDHGAPAEDGFLEGRAGVVLVDAASDTAASPARAGWDACLLVG
jgi:class I lanthipeptide synthase